METKKYFFGWTNIKWGIKELIKMYSVKESFFSYKRFQTGVAFFMFTQGAMYALKNYVNTIEGFIVWCAPVLLVCGYTLHKIEKAKTDENNKPS
jgi:hypothetical protein